MDKAGRVLGRAQTIQSASDQHLDDNAAFKKQGTMAPQSLNTSLVSQPVQKGSRNSKLDGDAEGTSQHMQHLRFTRRLNKMWKSHRNFREKKGVTRVEPETERRVKTQVIKFDALGSRNTIQLGNFVVEGRRNSKLKSSQTKRYTMPGVLEIAQEEKSEADASVAQLGGETKDCDSLMACGKEGPVAAIQLEPEEDSLEEEEHQSLQEEEVPEMPIGKPMFLRSTTQTVIAI